MTISSHTDSSLSAAAYDTPAFNILGQKSKRAATLAKRQTAKLPQKSKALKHMLLTLVSAGALSLSFTPAAMAQTVRFNDVDAFDGSVFGNCGLLTPVEATPSNFRSANIVGGSSHCLGEEASYNAVSGAQVSLGNYSNFNVISGDDNTLGYFSGANAVSGEDNVLGEYNFSNSVSGQNNFLGNGSDFDIRTQGNILGGTGNAIGATRALGDDGFPSDDDVFTAIDAGNNNIVSGSYNTLDAQSNDNVVGGTVNNLGYFSDNNAVNGFNNALGNRSSNNAVSGQGNVLGENTYSNAVSGFANALGDFTSFSVVGGSNNTLAGSIASDRRSGAIVLGDSNAINSTGSAGSNVSVIGSNNTVNGAGSGFNTVTGHNGTVDGTGNFVAGGNATSGPSVTGNDNVVIGAGASSVVDNGVAIGSGSTATLSQAAAQAAFTGTTVGDVTFTEGTDATGGEANLGNRLVTGVADGRIVAGSSDAINGNQLFQLSSSIGLNTAAVASNTSAIGLNTAAIGVNTAAIGVNTAAIGVNTEGINDLRDGAAALASLPDLYLNADETWSIAGGFSIYDDGFGGSETGFGGGIQVRSSTSDKWSVGVTGAFSGSASAVRVQGRFGG